MAYIRKIISAGPLVQEILYPRCSPGDSDRVRQAKRKASSDARKRINAKHSWQKLKLMLAANFQKGDVVGCLTYDDDHLKGSREQIRRTLSYFIKKLASARAGRGEELRMVWAIENQHGEKRWHIHFVCNSTGNDFTEIRRLWGRGMVELKRLCFDHDKNFESLAKYMCKEAREKVGLRAWSYTRSCRKPETETMTVPDRAVLRPPRGAILLASERIDGEWGRWQFIEYTWAAALRPRRKRSRR